MALNLDYRPCGYSEQELTEAISGLYPYCEELKLVTSHDIPESFLLLAQDTILSEQVLKTVTPADGVVLIGIGGSSLGTAAIARALQPSKRLLIVDAIDDQLLHATQEILEAEYAQGKKYHTIIVSQSGATLETLVNTSTLVPVFQKLDPDFAQRISVVTSANSPLSSYAKNQGWKIIASSTSITGRYSVLSAVGLVPLAALGIDIKKFLAGAQNMQKLCLEPNIQKNPALWGAAATFLNYQNGKSVHTLFHLNSSLQALSRWWQQLQSETLGKEGKGILPILSDTTDLHALGQLYMDGPRNIYTTFLESTVVTERNVVDTTFLPGLKEKNIGKISSAISRGVQSAYQKKGLPYATISFDTTDEESLGAFCILKMLETLYLARLIGVSPFDQPGVTLYKEEVQSILQS